MAQRRLSLLLKSTVVLQALSIQATSSCDMVPSLDASELAPSSYVEICEAVSKGVAGEKNSRKPLSLLFFPIGSPGGKPDSSTGRLWLQALRKLRQRPVGSSRDRKEALQAMNEIVGTILGGI